MRALPRAMRALPLARLFLGAVFIYAAWGKIFQPLQFAEAVANYRLLPLGLVNLVAHSLPMIELACGLLLILEVGVAGASLLLSLLLVGFAVGIGQAIWRGLDIECGCFSAAAERVGYPVLLRDLVLLFLSLTVLSASLKEASRRVRRIIL